MRCHNNMMNSILSILLQLLCFFTVTSTSSSASNIDGPIRLTTNKKKLKHNPITKKPHQWRLQEHSLTSNGEQELHSKHHRQKQQAQQKQEQQILLAKVEIIHPPHQSYLAGKQFSVKVKIHIPPNHEKLFQEEYQNNDNNDGHVCLSIDNGRYHCWNLYESILYANVSNANHTLRAALYKDGMIQQDTQSQEIMFTMVHDPTFEDPHTYVDFHSQISSNYKNKNTTDEEHKFVEVKYPVVQLLNPLHRVSYTGKDIEIKTKLGRTDESFKKYFQNGYICFDLDFATAHACYLIFNHHSHPLILGLDIGMHTIQASLIHTQTADLLHDSSIGRIIFFMAGEDNSGAAFVADINIHGKLHNVPMMHGGSIVAQAKHLCSSIGVNSSSTFEDCIEPIAIHLTNIVRQSEMLYLVNSTNNNQHV